MAIPLYLFLRQSIETFRTTGAILPSSPALASAIVAPVKRMAGERPLRIVEVGAGTGAISKALEDVLTSRDELDLIELNPQFADCLRQWARKRSNWGPKIRVIESDVCLVQPLKPYDALICGLPFNNFPAPLVERIFEHFLAMTAPNAPISFYEYIAIRKVKSLFINHQQRQQLRETATCIKDWVSRYKVSAKYVLANVPPAAVHHLRAPEREAEMELVELSGTGM